MEAYSDGHDHRTFLIDAHVHLHRCFEVAGVELLLLGRRKWDPRALVDLVRLVRERDIDILHLNGMKGILLGRIAARITGRPAVIHLHDATPVGAWLRFLHRRLAPWTGRALAVSEPVRRFAIGDFGLPPSRVEVLHNGIDLDGSAAPAPDARARIRRELGLEEGAPVIGSVGRLAAEKGHERLIRAMPAVLGQCPAAVLVIVGDGPTRGELERLAAALGLGTAVRFTGRRGDIPDLLAALDVAAVPSTCEDAFPNVALEAMAAGLPVVAFRTGGLPEVIAHGESGLLVPRGDVPKLAEALVRVLRDPTLRRSLGEAGRRRVQRLFTVERHARRLEQVYRVALESATSTGPVNPASGMHPISRHHTGPDDSIFTRSV